MADEYKRFEFIEQSIESVEASENFDDVPFKTIVVGLDNLRIPLVASCFHQTYFDLTVDLRHGLRAAFLAAQSIEPQPVMLVAYNPPRELAFLGTFIATSLVDRGLEGTGIKLNIESQMMKVGDWSLANEVDSQSTVGEAPVSISKKIFSGAKKALKTAGQWAAEYHENLKKAEHDEWQLSRREGAWDSEKPLPLLFEQVYDQLMKPIGKHRMSVSPDSQSGTLTATTSWQEYHSSAFPQAYRELHLNLQFLANDDGTTRVSYEWLVSENPPGSATTDLIIRSINQWLHILCNDASSAP